MMTSRRSQGMHCSMAATLFLVGCLLLLLKGTRRGYTYQYPRPALTVDNVVVQLPAGGQRARVLLIRRKNYPNPGYWALPGGFVDEGEPLDSAAARELMEETNLDANEAAVFTQVGTFGDPGRDPRGWLVDVVYVVLVGRDVVARAADDAADLGWHDVLSVPKPLAVDHQLIVRSALRHLAKQEAAQQVPGLVEQLLQGAERLEGPWQHIEGEMPPPAEPAS